MNHKENCFENPTKNTLYSFMMKFILDILKMEFVVTHIFSNSNIVCISVCINLKPKDWKWMKKKKMKEKKISNKYWIKIKTGNRKKRKGKNQIILSTDFRVFKKTEEKTKWPTHKNFAINRPLVSWLFMKYKLYIKKNSHKNTDDGSFVVISNGWCFVLLNMFKFLIIVICFVFIFCKLINKREKERKKERSYKQKRRRHWKTIH